MDTAAPLSDKEVHVSFARELLGIVGRNALNYPVFCKLDLLADGVPCHGFGRRHQVRVVINYSIKIIAHALFAQSRCLRIIRLILDGWWKSSALIALLSVLPDAITLGCCNIRCVIIDPKNGVAKLEPPTYPFALPSWARSASRIRGSCRCAHHCSVN